MKWWPSTWKMSRRQLELLFWLASIPFLATAGYRLLRYQSFQHSAQSFPAHQVTAATANSGLRVLGHLRVPRLRMDVAVLEGDDDATLALAPGHVPGTAPVGSSGNAVIAGHRDMAFRGLRNVRPGDQIQFNDGRNYTYVVKRLRVVKPEDLSVMANGNSAELTLITCYPFRFIGNAPERFIVQANLVSAAH